MCFSRRKHMYPWRDETKQLRSDFNTLFEEAFGPMTNEQIIDYGDKKVWYKNGIVHNNKGPAIVYPNGSKKYYLDGIELPESVFLAKVQEEENRIIYSLHIKGVDYKVTGKELQEVVKLLQSFQIKQR